ncbi:MAG: hypothetical protein IID37_05685 [Planctomycetes bacterium]|nr:hypothetical protein [Planctomycetota bacterium]
MMGMPHLRRPDWAKRLFRMGAAVVAMTAPLWGAGCSALNPAFVDTLAFVDQDSIIASSTLENAPGHIPVMLINNTIFSSELLAFLERFQPGSIPDDADLRPRVRFRVTVMFTDGNTTTFEFVDGSQLVQGDPIIGDPDFDLVDLILPTDLTENALTNAVVLCDVALVTIDGVIEMFVPVNLKEIQVQDAGQGTEPTRQLTTITLPQFVPLLVDEVDDNNTVIVLRNFGTRDIPAPATNLLCGTVVAIVLNGTLTVPFVVDENGETVPGFLDTDAGSQTSIPGRFDLELTLQ